MTDIVTFEVLGVPAPQGSKVAFIAQGKARTKEASTSLHAQWRNAVGQTAKDIADTADFPVPLDGALGLTVEFRFPMPKSRPRAARIAGHAPKITAPDVSKLIRNTEDALQAAGLICDDARFCRIEATKVETVGWHGATITITREGWCDGANRPVHSTPVDCVMTEP